MKLSRSLQKKLANNLIEVIPPEEIVSDFDSIFGLNNAKEVLQDIVTFFESGSAAIQPYTSYAIVGPHGSRKASLAFATAKAANIPVVSLDMSIFSTKEEEDIAKKLQLIFDVAEIVKKDYPGCIIIFQNIDQTEEMDNDNIFYLNLIKEFRNTENIFIFGLSSLNTWAVPAFVMQSELFEATITLDLPDLPTREKIFEACIKKENLKLASDVSINRLAKDTIGETQRSIEHIVKDTHLYSLRQKHTEVTQSDFSETIMKLSAGEKNFKMSEKERKLCAYHEAGHVIAGYFSDPEYVLKRVEISPRSQGSLGLTATDIDENKHSYFKNDFENIIIECLGGMCAEEVVFGAHTSGVVSDLAQATSYAASMIGAYGMNDAITPMVLVTGVTDSLYARSIVEKETQTLLKDLLAKTTKIIAEHRPYLDTLASALVEKEVVLGNEIEDIFDKVDAEMHEIETLSFDNDDIDE